MIDDYLRFKTPGQFIQAMIDQNDWTQRVVAVMLEVEESLLNRIIKGKKSVSAELAIRLSEVFGVPAKHFLELQSSFDLAQAELMVVPDPARFTRTQLFGKLPVSEMIKRGWLDATDVRDVPKVEAALVKFFRAKSPEEILLPHAAKKTNVNAEATPVQMAWLFRVKEIAEEMLVPPYSESAVRAAVPKLKELLISGAAIRKVPRILTECGIRFVIVEALPSSKIDGVCFWIDDTPVIGMSLRYDRIDNFWFVLRHEIEHAIQLHGRESAMLDFDLEGERAGTGTTVPEEERIANEAAAEFCVPQKSLQNFIARKSPFFYERDIIGFAATMRVHPGLVAGQLRRKLDEAGVKGAYSRFTNHLVKIRSIIAPSATVDGWGDVVPVG